MSLDAVHFRHGLHLGSWRLQSDLLFVMTASVEVPWRFSHQPEKLRSERQKKPHRLIDNAAVCV
jgi:hypothetical protein